jgi:hypothetical protein
MLSLYNEDQLSLRESPETEVGAKCPPTCEDVSPEEDERPLLEDVTKQRSEDRDWEHLRLRHSDF